MTQRSNAENSAALPTPAVVDGECVDGSGRVVDVEVEAHPPPSSPEALVTELLQTEPPEADATEPIEAAGAELLDPPEEPPETFDPATAAPAARDWYRHESGRFVVGDPGRQLDIVPVFSKFERPDTVVDGAAIGSLVLRAASLRGLSHQQTGKARQDAFGFQLSANQAWLVGTVADGVSSGPRSHEAADIAVRRLTAVLTGALDDVPVPDEGELSVGLLTGLPWQLAVDDASDAILAEASDQVRAAFVRQGQHDRAEQMDLEGMPVGAAVRIMATTAIAFVIATGVDADGALPFAVLPAAGDSSALVLADTTWHPITAVKNEHAEIASSAVRPLPGRYDVAPVIDVLRPGEALAVITDGLGDPLGSGGSAVGRFLARSWSVPPDILEFAHHVGFLRRTFVDDRTAMVTWNTP